MTEAVPVHLEPQMASAANANRRVADTGIRRATIGRR
jgi:hypothetical protein